MVETLMVVVLKKSGEIVLEIMLKQLWTWVLSDRNFQRASNVLKMQILILYLDWVLLKTPLKLPHETSLVDGQQSCQPRQ